jgi:Uma2 family endonuclease
MVQSPSKTLTLEAFLKLPETKPASEYIDGQVIQKPMPQGKHSALQGDLVPVINTSLRSRQIARAFPELRCNFGGRSIIPDISVFTWDCIPRDNNGEIANTFNSAPDWTIEILSPDQNPTKVIKNILHCLRYGTQMGWLIDPAEQIILVHQPKQALQLFDESNVLLPVPDFAKSLTLSVGELFGWLLG